MYPRSLMERQHLSKLHNAGSNPAGDAHLKIPNKLGLNANVEGDINA